jgi:uncharacterized protein
MQFLEITLKRAFWSIFLCLVLISFPQPSWAVTVQDVPNPQEQSIRGWVTDMANLLDSDTKVRLNQMLSKLERKNGTEMAIVIVPDTVSAATPKEFATQLFNYWGIGKKGINNGVLFLISKSDRRVEIETGKMVEAILPNDKVGEIINQEIIPSFKQDNFADGILVGTQALVMALEKHNFISITSQNQDKLQAPIGLLIILLLIMAVIIMIISGIAGALNNDKDDKRRRPQSSEGGEISISWDADSSGSWGGDSGDSGGGGDGGDW